MASDGRYVGASATNPFGVYQPVPELTSTELYNDLHLISSGECYGLWDKTTPTNSVFLNGTAATNFTGAVVEERTGKASQTIITGFEASSSDTAVNATLLNSAPLTRTVSSTTVDAVRVIIQFPLGIQYTRQDGTASSQNVVLNFFVKKSTDTTWTQVIRGAAYSWHWNSNRVTIGPGDFEVWGVASSSFEKAFTINCPDSVKGADGRANGLWDIKVVRVTPDYASGAQNICNTTLYRITEIQNVSLTYPNRAIVGLKYSSQQATDAWPQTFDFGGLLINVPSNFNPSTRTYTGVWDGTFSSTKQWTDDSAWILYDLLTNTRYGLGKYIKSTDIDTASFYAASVYNNQLVDNFKGGTEPRFTFNAQITVDEDSWKTLQLLAGTFNAALYVSSGLIRLVQDRPTDASVVVTPSSISEEGFNFSTSASATRYTACRVTYTEEIYGASTTTVLEEDNTTNFPYNVADLNAWGCTSESQARRIARWYIDTQLRNTEVVTYKAPLSHCNVEPGTVIKLMDPDWANTAQAAQIISVSGTTVVLDRPVTISGGTNYIDVVNGNGTGLEQKTITNSAGSANTITVSSAFATTLQPYTPVIITGNIQPRLFRVTDIKESDNGFYEVVALQYDPTKYSRVETGIVRDSGNYSDTSSTIPAVVTNITFAASASGTGDAVKRNISVAWTKSADALSYTVQWRCRGDVSWTTVTNVSAPYYVIADVITGIYDVNIYSVSKYGLASAPVAATYTLDTSGVGTTPVVLNPVTSLYVAGTTGLTFATADLTVSWVNPATNATKNPALKDFVVKVYKTDGTLLRTSYVDAVSAGSTASFTYAWSNNITDGGPFRSVRVDVFCRDGLNNLSTATTATFTNAVPAAPSNITITGLNLTNKIFFDLPSDRDVEGILIWRGTATGFALSKSSCVYDGPAAGWVNDPVPDNIKYYYKLATYDSFGKAYDGAGLNISAEYSVTTLGVDSAKVVGNFTAAQLANISITATMLQNSGIAGIEILGALPTTGNFTGRQVFLTTDNKLYRYNGSAFTKSVDGADLVSNSVTARSIAIGDFTNFCTNGEGLSADGWSSSTTPVAVPGLPAGWWGSASTSRSALNILDRDTLFGAAFPVTPADEFFVSFVSQAEGGGASLCSLSLGLVTYDGVGNVIAWTAGATRAVGAAGIQSAISGTVVIPAGAATAKIWVQQDKTPGTYTSTAGYVHYLTNIIVRKKATGKLIVDGSIVTNHLSSGLVTTDKLAANSVNMAKCATDFLAADSAQMRSVVIRNSSGAVAFSSGAGLSSDYYPPSGANLIYNSSFDYSPTGQTSTPGPGFGSVGGYLIGSDNSGVNLNSSWKPTGDNSSNCFYAHQAGRYGNSSAYLEIMSNAIPVEGGSTYILSGYTGAHRAQVSLFLYTYNAAGNLAGYHVACRSDNNAEMWGGQNLNGYKRQWGKTTLPSDISHVRVMMRKYDTLAGDTDSWMFVTRLMLEKVAVNATGPGEWSDGSVSNTTAVSLTNPITSSNIGTYIADATIGSAKIQNVIQSDNWDGANGWAIRKSDGWANFGNVTLRGWIHSNFPSGYSWAGNAATGQYGFYVGPEGALWGNPNMGSGGYFQITKQGDVYSNKFSVVNGSVTATDITINRNLSVATVGIPCAGTYAITAGSGWKLLYTTNIDTGVVVGDAWSANDRNYAATAGISNGTVNLWTNNGSYGSFYANWWIKVTSVWSMTRWASSATIWCTVEVWAVVDGGTFQMAIPNGTLNLYRNK